MKCWCVCVGGCLNSSVLFNRFAVRNGVDSCICRRAVAWLSRLYDHCVCSCAYIYTLAFQVFSFHVSVCRFWVCIFYWLSTKGSQARHAVGGSLKYDSPWYCFFGGRLAASAVTPHGRASTVSRRSLGHKRWAGCRPPFWQHLLLGVGGQRGWGCATVLSYYIQW